MTSRSRSRGRHQVQKKRSTERQKSQSRRYIEDQDVQVALPSRSQDKSVSRNRGTSITTGAYHKPVRIVEIEMQPSTNCQVDDCISELSRMTSERFTNNKLSDKAITSLENRQKQLIE